MNVYLEWQEFKTHILEAQKLRWTDRDEFYLLSYSDDGGIFESSIIKDSGTDHTDFESNYKEQGNKSVIRQVITQYEKNDKTLRCICAFADTDSNGEAVIAVPVPTTHGGRWIAYADAEFEVRHFGDRISAAEVADLDRGIAWQIALAGDPEATEPVSDATVQAMGYPLYPVVGYYDERDIDQGAANKAGTIYGGIGMTLQFGVTEAQPIGGYGWIPGGLYLVLKGQKATGQTTGHKLQVSIDWAEQV
jgi:hypothetical protein